MLYETSYNNKHYVVVWGGVYMAEIISLVLCENVQPGLFQDADGNSEIRPSIISPFNLIQPIAVPGNFSFCIYMILGNINKNVKNTIQIKIIAPDKKTVFSTGMFDVEPKAIIDNNVTFSLDLRNFVFMQEGNYYINISFNDEEVCNQSFEVRKKVDL